jgi:hypothetical protein
MYQQYQSHPREAASGLEMERKKQRVKREGQQ